MEVSSRKVQVGELHEVAKRGRHAICEGGAINAEALKLRELAKGARECSCELAVLEH